MADMIRDSQIGRDSDREITICPVRPKIYGASPSKFSTIRKINREEIVEAKPARWTPVNLITWDIINLKGAIKIEEIRDG